MYYYAYAKVVNGRTVYDNTEANSMNFHLNKIFDESQSSLERAEATIIRENEERERAIAEGRNPKDISGVKAIISDDNGNITIEDAFTIEAGPLGYHTGDRYVESRNYLAVPR